ncbi:MAG: hypothetical protein LUG19_13485 [Desulfovibrio sp.]|uniref:hypothetical protein n=1 Tax=Desulfovibrio sp. TaxID=885 RepID=UPI00258FEC47|nr:hypothetical protein [Desulfovibrio sp.]MCD7985239.1 hypothetical protein [Desulfovibrio sp.]
MNFDLTPIFTVDFAKWVILSILGALLLVSPELLMVTTGAAVPAWKEIILVSLGCGFIGVGYGGIVLTGFVLLVIKVTKNATHYWKTKNTNKIENKNKILE